MFPLILLVAASLAEAEDGAVRMDNQLCKVRREVVALDPLEHKYLPFFVELHRCRGSCGPISPKIHHCAAKQWTDIHVQVYDTSDRKHKTLVVRNHTACVAKCTQSPDRCQREFEYWSEENCRCECLYKKQPPATPKEGFRWNPTICRYECNRAPENCPHKMVWNRDTCSCTCRKEIVEHCRMSNVGIDKECTCVDVEPVENGHRAGLPANANLFIILLICEAVVIVGLGLGIAYLVRKARDSPKERPPGQAADETDHIKMPHKSLESIHVENGCVGENRVEPAPV